MADKRSSSSPTIKLEKILGVTTLSNACIATAPRSNDVFYAAGSIVIRYNAAQNLQKSFFKASKAVSCLSVSVDGQYLAVGERGQSPSVFVFEISSGKTVATIFGTHKHGIGCLVFSPDSRYLVSAGFKHDRQLIVWDWENLRAVSVQKIGNKVNSLCFHPNGSYFISCGDRHLKWWYITHETGIIGSLDVVGKPASILENHKNTVFMDMKIGLADKVYCTTSTGLLCAFNDTRFMDMWVQLESSVSYSLSTSTIGGLDVVIVGCTEGLIRMFSAKSLQYLSTLPLPVPTVGYTEKYPACLALCCVEGAPSRGSAGTRSPKLVAVYADHSIFVWNMEGVNNTTMCRSFAYHRSCIWDVQFITSTDSSELFPPGTFVTCSADNSIRIWSGDRARCGGGTNVLKQSSARPAPVPVHGEILHMVEVSPLSSSTVREIKAPVTDVRQSHLSSAASVSSSMATTIADITADPNSAILDVGTGLPDLELPYRPQVAQAPRSMAVHPLGRQLACGDGTGLLRVFDLANMREMHSAKAHAAEILTLHYSPPLRSLDDGSWTVDHLESQDNEEALVLLATAGRDRLIHVFNASEGYDPVSTLDHHSSAVTVVKFTPDGTKLLSCGADRAMVFSSVAGTDIVCSKSVQTPHNSINGLSIEASNKFAVTSGQDRRLNIWNLQSGKHVRAYKNDVVTGELYKSDVDPSGMYVAACAFDKTVNLFDFFSGDLLAQVSGHSELITAVRFSPDGRHLLSVGGDGCIMIWAMAEPFVAAMQERASELLLSSQKRQSKNFASRGSDVSKSNGDSPPLGLGPGMRGLPIVPPPPPSDVVVKSAAAVEGIRTEARRGVADSVGEAASSGRGSRWASRVDPHGGYELFGRKMGSAAPAQKMKLTLEPSSFADIGNLSDDNEHINSNQEPGHGQGHSIGLNVKDEISDDKDVDMNDDSVEEDPYEGNQLAKTLEAGDDVMGFEGSDDGASKQDKISKKSLNKMQSPPFKEDEYEDDFDAGNDNDNDSGSEAFLAKATSKIDTLEQSATHLENWLENMIRNGSGSEAKNTNPVPGPSSSATDTAGQDQSTLLSSSLSSLFFKNRQLSNKLNGKDKDKDKEKEKEDEKARSEVDTFNDDDLPLPPPHIAEKKKYKEIEKENEKDLLSEIPSDKRDLDASVLTMDSLRPTSPSSSPDDILDFRRKETIAALAQMKYKLRNMGVLGVTGEIGRKLEYRDRNRASPPTAQAPSKSDIHALIDSEDGYHSSGDTGSHPVPGFVPVRAPASPGAQSKRAKSPSTLSEEAVPPPPPPRTSHTKQSKCRSRSASPKPEVLLSTPHGYGLLEVDVDADDEDYGSVQGTIAFESVPVPGSPSYLKTSATASVFHSKDCEEQERGQGQGQGQKSLKPMALALPLTQHNNLNNFKSLLHNDGKNGVKVASPRMTSAPNSPSKERSVSPRMTSAPNSPSKERSRGGAVRVVTDDTNSIEQKEDPFTDLCKMKEEKLRLKALQCKQIISDLERARVAALRSFDDLAELRADLNQTMASTSTHFATKCQAGESSTDIGMGMSNGMERCMGDLNGSGVSNFSGIFACNPPRGGMENTATILQGSIVIAEADALIMSFRQSYMAPSSSSKAGMFMSTTTTSAQPDNSVGMRNAIEDALEERRSGSSAMDRSNLSNDSHCDESQHFLPSDTDNRGSSVSNNNRHNKTVQSRKDDSVNEIEMFAFLEKYSDRLADMVSDKMIAKSIAMDKSFKSP